MFRGEPLLKCFPIFMTNFTQKKDFWKLPELTLKHSLTEICGLKIRYFYTIRLLKSKLFSIILAFYYFVSILTKLSSI